MFNNLTSRQILWLVVIVAIALIVGLSGAWYLKEKQNQALTAPAAPLNESAQTEETQLSLIGGDKDENGCVIGAGYSWCEAKKECIRVWETYCTAAEPKTAMFTCADEKIIIAVFYPSDDKFVDLDLGGDRKMSIPRAISASGARYAKADESFVFWNKGNTAFITEDGVETYKDCVTNN